MATAKGLERKRRPDLQFWSMIIVWFVVMSGIMFGLQLWSGESVGPSLAFAASIALFSVVYYVGYRAGRRDYETPHPTTFVPPPKQR